MAHKAKTLPRDNLLHLEKHQGQHGLDVKDTNGHMSEDHDGEQDDEGTPDVPLRGYISDEAEDDVPELPPREYNWSDFESDPDDDDDAGESEVMVQKIYENLAKFGGPSKETEKLYDTLEQYQKVILARKQSLLPSGEGALLRICTLAHKHTRTHTHTHQNIRTHIHTSANTLLYIPGVPSSCQVKLITFDLYKPQFNSVTILHANQLSHNTFVDMFILTSFCSPS